MKNKIISEMLCKKKLGKKEFDDYLTERIKMLDSNSEEIVIGVSKNNKFCGYTGYIGKNVKVDTAINLLDNIYEEETFRYIQFDGDERITELLYNNIQEGELLSLLMLMPSLTSMTSMDSLISMNNPQLRDNFINSNAKLGKVTKYSEIKKQFMCLCTEKAMLFHNICKILGLDSQIMFGTIEKNGVLNAHAYNIVIADDKKIIVDLASSIQTSKDKQPQVLVPIAVIADDDYDKLVNGEKVSVDMSTLTNTVYKYNCLPTSDKYGVGLSEEDKNILLQQNIISNKKLVLDFFNKIKE